VGAVSQWFNQILKSLKVNAANRGQVAEFKAEKYLIKKGLKLLARNYQTKAGEIDLIMLDKDQLVFIEVRYKQNDAWASSVESVTIQKQRKIIKAAKYYLQKHEGLSRKACRFDVIAMSGELESAQIEWFQHAFY